MEANKSITDFISEIKIDRSNLEHIAKTGKINGSLFLEIQDKMRAFASQELLCAIPDYESNKTAEAKKQEIISITEATVAAYSNAPVWYKQEIEKYMDTYASTLQKELDETKQKLQESDKRELLIGFFKRINQYENLKYSDNGIAMYVDDYLRTITPNQVNKVL